MTLREIVEVDSVKEFLKSRMFSRMQAFYAHEVVRLCPEEDLYYILVYSFHHEPTAGTVIGAQVKFLVPVPWDAEVAREISRVTAQRYPGRIALFEDGVPTDPDAFLERVGTVASYTGELDRELDSTPHPVDVDFCGHGRVGSFLLDRVFPKLGKLYVFEAVSFTARRRKVGMVAEFVYWPSGSKVKKALLLNGFLLPEKVAWNASRHFASTVGGAAVRVPWKNTVRDPWEDPERFRNVMSQVLDREEAEELSGILARGGD